MTISESLSGPPSQQGKYFAVPQAQQVTRQALLSGNLQARVHASFAHNSTLYQGEFIRLLQRKWLQDVGGCATGPLFEPGTDCAMGQQLVVALAL